MNYDIVISTVLQVMLIAGLLALVISVLMEFVIKPIFKPLLTTVESLNVVILVMSIAITFISMLAYCDIKSVHLLWYMYFGIIALGCLVSGIAMNGYDKVLSFIYSWLKQMFSKEV